MEPPPAQAIESSGESLQVEDDERDKIVNDCCSCCYDCANSCLDYLCCYNIC
ncbi:hypothetical protein NMG60_11008100 [Bertholletia excelsa]